MYEKFCSSEYIWLLLTTALLLSCKCGKYLGFYFVNNLMPKTFIAHKTGWTWTFKRSEFAQRISTNFQDLFFSFSHQFWINERKKIPQCDASYTQYIFVRYKHIPTWDSRETPALTSHFEQIDCVTLFTV